MNWKILFNLAALALGLALAVGLCFNPASKSDVWSYPAAGEQIAAQGSFPDSDPLRFSADGPAAFDKQSWLFSLLAVGLAQSGGPQALQIFKYLCLILAFGFCVATAFRRGSRPFS